VIGVRQVDDPDKADGADRRGHVRRASSGTPAGGVSRQTRKACPEAASHGLRFSVVETEHRAQVMNPLRDRFGGATCVGLNVVSVGRNEGAGDTSKCCVARPSVGVTV
jgi:hypothetical protein